MQAGTTKGCKRHKNLCDRGIRAATGDGVGVSVGLPGEWVAIPAYKDKVKVKVKARDKAKNERGRGHVRAYCFSRVS